MKMWTKTCSIILAVSALWGSACSTKSSPDPIVPRAQGYTQVSQPLPGGGQRSIIVFSEEGHWQAITLREKPGAIPEHESTQAFPTQSQAMDYAKSIEDTPAPSIPTPSATPTEAPLSPLWKVTQAWSSDWENQYSQWVRDEISPEFFKNHAIATDCADVAYGLRWIFARNHGLPAADHLVGDGYLLTQDSMKPEWMALPTSDLWYEDQRFLAALDTLFRLTFTHTLLQDSYPVAINPETFKEGIHHLAVSGSSGHTLVVKKVDLSSDQASPLTMMNSTVPQEIRVLAVDGYWSPAQPTEETGGFLRFQWPILDADQKWTLTDKSKHPFYSNEEYTPEFMETRDHFAESVLIHLNPGLDFHARLKEGIASLKSQLQMRVNVVKRGIEVCKSEDCGETTQAYDDWSTPSRDRRIQSLVVYLEDLISRYGEHITAMKDTWKSALVSSAKDTTGLDTSLGSLLLVWKLGVYSYDPREAEHLRWGVAPQAFAQGMVKRIRPLFDARSVKIGEQVSTTDIDGRLQDLSIGVDEFCAVEPGKCEALHGALAQLSFSYRGVDRSVGAWLDLTPWLVSDPKAPEAIRWGEHAADFDRIVLGGNVEVEAVSRSGLAQVFQLGRAESSRQLLEFPSGKARVLPDGVKLLSMDLDSEKLLVENEQGLLQIRSLEGVVLWTQDFESPSEAAPVTAFWSSTPGRLELSREGKNSSFQITESIEGVRITKAPPQKDFSEKIPKDAMLTYDSRFAVVDAASGVQFVGLTDDASGSPEEVPGSYNTDSQDFANQNYYSVASDQITSGPDEWVLRYKEGQWQTFNYLPDDLEFRGFNSGYVITKTTQNAFRLRSFDQKIPLFEAPMRFMYLLCAAPAEARCDYFVSDYAIGDHSIRMLYSVAEPSVPILNWQPDRALKSVFLELGQPLVEEDKNPEDHIQIYQKKGRLAGTTVALPGKRTLWLKKR